MAEDTVLRVALLARAGEAREQLRRAIVDLGADLVVEADPNELDAGALAGAGATTVLVSVEPAVEAALERLDEVLLVPGLKVMYDEAETTSKLQGWDLNRWARHLAAKLMGRDLLPPGAEGAAHEEAAERLVPGAPSTPAALADHARIGDFADEISASARAVPAAVIPGAGDGDVSEDAPVAVSAAWATPPAAEGDQQALGLDLAALEQAMGGATAVAGADDTVTDDVIDLRGLELVDDAERVDAPRSSGPSLSLLNARELRFDRPADPAADPDADPAADPHVDAPAGMEVEELTLSEAELAAFGHFSVDSPLPGPLGRPANDASSREAEGRADPIDGEALAPDAGADAEFARLAAAFDDNLESLSFESASDDPPGDGTFALDGIDGLDGAGLPAALPDAATGAPPSRPAPPAAPDFGFADGALPPPPSVPTPAFHDSRLQLAPLDDLPAASPPSVPSMAAPQRDLSHLSLSPLADGSDGPAEAGSVLLVLSGIGGPDAVRQLLRALPANFPLAVLLQQTLDGGRHERFVEQLARISRLPVALAEPHETPPPRAVRVLPEGVTSAGALGAPGAGGLGALIAAAHSKDGAVILLSGADEAAIEPLKRAMAEGLRVLVQDPSSCFDGKAASALREAGAPALPAADLAARLDAFFPA